MDVTRDAGVLLPIFSLPSKYGVGDFGKEAYRFVDFLADSGQSLWQILPLGPTEKYNSPYQNLSAFAGNPWFIDLDQLADEGLLTAKEVRQHGRALADFPAPGGRVNYRGLMATRGGLLYKAAGRYAGDEDDYRHFYVENRWWLDKYAGFVGDPLQCVVQYFFYRQWKRLKRYANARGIAIIGDLALYVSKDSCDFLKNPELFQVKMSKSGECEPKAVAGVPPDNFSDEGQIWNTPLYNWAANRKTEYRWWMKRIRQASQLYDHLRIDHFRGLAGYFSIPVGSPASEGHWEKGPGRDFVDAVKEAAPGLGIIAEDLGFLTEDVIELRKYSGWRGMKLLQSGFSMEGETDYLPHNHVEGCVVYPGTHDNRTLKGWAESLKSATAKKAMEYFGLDSRDGLPMAMLRAALGSVAETAIVPLHDWMGLGDSARINTPGTVGDGNWSWRLEPGYATKALKSHILALTLTYDRAHNN